jgi:mRNA-degrading endonuclease RelE of RelBE toxin-antitoxin system
MSYQVFVKPTAQRQLKKLTLAIQKDLIAHIESLSEEPNSLSSKN